MYTMNKEKNPKILSSHLCAKIIWESLGKKKSLANRALEKIKRGLLLEWCSRNKMALRVRMIKVFRTFKTYSTSQEFNKTGS